MLFKLYVPYNSKKDDEKDVKVRGEKRREERRKGASSMMHPMRLSYFSLSFLLVLLPDTFYKATFAFQ